MNNYYRITAYHPEEDISAIFDSYGMFEKKWQFSSFLVQKGLCVLEVSSADKFLNGNIPRAPENTEKLLLRANAKGKPEYVTQAIDGVTYTVVKVADKFYVPDRTQTV